MATEVDTNATLDPALAAFTAFKFMATATGATNAAPAAVRCMGRRCRRRAEFAVLSLDETQGAHEYPIKLCRSCLCRITPDGSPVDLFRWLSDNRIEANA